MAVITQEVCRVGNVPRAFAGLAMTADLFVITRSGIEQLPRVIFEIDAPKLRPEVARQYGQQRNARVFDVLRRE
jgi:hypothetical protein